MLRPQHSDCSGLIEWLVSLLKKTHCAQVMSVAEISKTWICCTATVIHCMGITYLSMS